MSSTQCLSQSTPTKQDGDLLQCLYADRDALLSKLRKLETEVYKLESLPAHTSIHRLHREWKRVAQDGFAHVMPNHPKRRLLESESFTEDDFMFSLSSVSSPIVALRIEENEETANQTPTASGVSMKTRFPTPSTADTKSCRKRSKRLLVPGKSANSDTSPKAKFRKRNRTGRFVKTIELSPEPRLLAESYSTYMSDGAQVGECEMDTVAFGSSRHGSATVTLENCCVGELFDANSEPEKIGRIEQERCDPDMKPSAAVPDDGEALATEVNSKEGHNEATQLVANDVENKDESIAQDSEHTKFGGDHEESSSCAAHGSVSDALLVTSSFGHCVDDEWAGVGTQAATTPRKEDNDKQPICGLYGVTKQRKIRGRLHRRNRMQGRVDEETPLSDDACIMESCCTGDGEVRRETNVHGEAEGSNGEQKTCALLQVERTAARTADVEKSSHCVETRSGRRMRGASAKGKSLCPPSSSSSCSSAASDKPHPRSEVTAPRSRRRCAVTCAVPKPESKSRTSHSKNERSHNSKLDDETSSQCSDESSDSSECSRVVHRVLRRSRKRCHS